MPVHNAQPFLDESVGSILNQTFADFEFVILDDGSTDGSTEALREWAQRDARIRLYESARNLGPAGSSNFVVERARAPLVARMDADDVSHPDRLRRQWEVLERRPDVALVGTLYEGIDARGRRVRPRDRWRLARPTDQPAVPARLRAVPPRSLRRGGRLPRRVRRLGGSRPLPADAATRARSSPSTRRFTSTGSSRRADNGPRVAPAGIGLRQRCLAEALRGRDYAQLLEARAVTDTPQTPTRSPTRFTCAARCCCGRATRRRCSARPGGRSLSVRRPRALRNLAWAGWAEPSALRACVSSCARSFARATSWRAAALGTVKYTNGV